MLKIIDKDKLAKVILMTCSIGTGIAMLSMPYGYYILLRISFFFSLLTIAYLIYENIKETSALVLLLIVTSIIYNPILPIHLGSKAAWSVINIGTVFLLFFSVRQIQSKRSSKD